METQLRHLSWSICPCSDLFESCFAVLFFPQLIGNNRTLENIYLSPGRACNNYKGQCSNKGECVNVDGSDGRTNLFDSDTLNAVSSYWLAGHATSLSDPSDVSSHVMI